MTLAKDPDPVDAALKVLQAAVESGRGDAEAVGGALKFLHQLQPTIMSIRCSRCGSPTDLLSLEASGSIACPSCVRDHLIPRRSGPDHHTRGKVLSPWRRLLVVSAAFLAGAAAQRWSHSGDGDRSDRVARSLAKLSEPGSVEDLRRIARDLRHPLASHAYVQLSHSDDPEVLPIALEHLQSGIPKFVGPALDVLGDRRADVRKLQTARDVTKASSVSERIPALYALAASGDVAAERALIGLVTPDQMPYPLVAAIRRLVRLEAKNLELAISTIEAIPDEGRRELVRNLLRDLLWTFE